MKECLTLQQIADNSGTWRVTVCQQNNNPHLSVNLVWKTEDMTILNTTSTCERSCRALHEVLILQGVEMKVADMVCDRLNLN